MVAVDQMGQLVGDDVFECRGGGLHELPVDTDDAVPPAGTPAVPGVGQAEAGRLQPERRRLPGACLVPEA